ncbi:MAG: fumarylacetoacetate hydrolase family protein, partial [Cyclobacteriaceae bacterium]
MKLYRVHNGIIIEKKGLHYSFDSQEWDSFINDDKLHGKMENMISDAEPGSDLLDANLLAPIQSQELWASGVTYYRSKEGREQESEDSGGAQFYAKVYEADRP